MSSCESRFAFTRIQVEYIEMPDLKLTPAQIRRLCDLPQDICEVAILALEESGFLWRAPDGRFIRRALGRPGREISEPLASESHTHPVAGSLGFDDHVGNELR
jgi:hypothetical protein